MVLPEGARRGFRDVRACARGELKAVAKISLRANFIGNLVEFPLLFDKVFDKVFDKGPQGGLLQQALAKYGQSPA